MFYFFSFWGLDKRLSNVFFGFGAALPLDPHPIEFLSFSSEIRAYALFQVQQQSNESLILTSERFSHGTKPCTIGVPRGAQLMQSPKRRKHIRTHTCTCTCTHTHIHTQHTRTQNTHTRILCSSFPLDIFPTITKGSHLDRVVTEVADQFVLRKIGENLCKIPFCRNDMHDAHVDLYRSFLCLGSKNKTSTKSISTSSFHFQSIVCVHHAHNSNGVLEVLRSEGTVCQNDLRSEPQGFAQTHLD